MVSPLDCSNSLAGSVLAEKDITLTRRFLSIMGAAGRMRSAEISGHLLARGLIPKDSADLMSNYLKLIVDVCLLGRLEVFGRRKGASTGTPHR